MRNYELIHSPEPIVTAADITTLPFADRAEFLVEKYLPGYEGLLFTVTPEKAEAIKQLSPDARKLLSLLVGQEMFDAAHLVPGTLGYLQNKYSEEKKGLKEGKKRQLAEQWAPILQFTQQEITSAEVLTHTITDTFFRDYLKTIPTFETFLNSTIELVKLDEGLGNLLIELMKKVAQRFEDRKTKIGSLPNEIPLEVVQYKSLPNRNIMMVEATDSLPFTLQQAFLKLDKEEGNVNFQTELQRIHRSLLDLYIRRSDELYDHKEKYPNMGFLYDFALTAAVISESVPEILEMFRWWLEKMGERHHGKPRLNSLKEEMPGVASDAGREQIAIFNLVISRFGAPTKKDPESIMNWAYELPHLFVYEHNKKSAIIGTQCERYSSLITFAHFIDHFLSKEGSHLLGSQTLGKFMDTAFRNDDSPEGWFKALALNWITLSTMNEAHELGVRVADHEISTWLPRNSDLVQFSRPPASEENLLERFRKNEAEFIESKEQVTPELVESYHRLTAGHMIEVAIGKVCPKTSEELMTQDEEVNKLKREVIDAFSHFIAWRGDSYRLEKNEFLKKYHIESITFYPIEGQAGAYGIVVEFDFISIPEVKKVRFKLHDTGLFTLWDDFPIDWRKEQQVAFMRLLLPLLNYITSGEAFRNTGKGHNKEMVGSEQEKERESKGKRSHWRTYRDGRLLDSDAADKHRREVWNDYRIDTYKEITRRRRAGVLADHEIITYVRELDRETAQKNVPNQFVYPDEI